MKIIALLLCLPLTVFARPQSEAIANMKAWCDCVMVGGVCQVTNDTKPRKPGSKVFTAAGPIDAAVWDAYKNDPRMCDNGAKACAVWDSDACKAYRLMFRQEPMVCVRPGEPRKK
jgi:hypothetical protein